MFKSGFAHKGPARKPENRITSNSVTAAVGDLQLWDISHISSTNLTTFNFDHQHIEAKQYVRFSSNYSFSGLPE